MTAPAHPYTWVYRVSISVHPTWVADGFDDLRELAQAYLAETD